LVISIQLSCSARQSHDIIISEGDAEELCNRLI
jgi:hypothetical protein